MKFKPICFFASEFLTRAQCCRNLRGEASEKVRRKWGKVLRKQL